MTIFDFNYCVDYWFSNYFICNIYYFFVYLIKLEFEWYGKE